MNWNYIFLHFFVTVITVKCTLQNCNYQYKYSCYNDKLQQDEFSSMYETNKTRCSLSNILDDAKYTLILSKNGSFATGILKVNVSLPSVNCNYSVALLVNDNIKNEEECHWYDFKNEFNKELHSMDQSICVTQSTLPERLDNNVEKCKKNDVVMYFQHVYTGCYALRYTIDGYNFAIRSRKYIMTDYRRVEIEEPKFHCAYDNRNDINDRKNLVTFTFSISLSADISSAILKLVPLSFIYENKENACSRYSDAPQYIWEIINGRLKNMDGASMRIENCNSMMVHVANGTYTEDIECSFALPVSYNDSYCFFIAFHDDRCIQNSIWNPPPRDDSTVACTWMSKCTRIVKATRAVEYNGELKESKLITADTTLLLLIAIGLIFLMFIIFSLLIWINKLCIRRNIQQTYLHTNLRDLNAMKSVVEVDEINDTDDDNEKIEKLLDDKAIVLLYAKGSKAFMGFMSDFRDVLKLYCNCHIYDWYAACEWDAVARVHAFDWATELFKKNYRAVWIDTPTVRTLLTAEIASNTSDFRDMAFPAVLDYAKRSIINTKLQYSKHFIVRLEGYENANSTNDPFADLSPHARYLIPYHLSQLCSHLSSKRSDSCGHALMTEELKLREQLIHIKSYL